MSEKSGMKAIALIRHGLDFRDTLTPKGVAQINNAGEWLSQFFPKPVRICCSPTGRARETAEILTSHIPVEQIIECHSLDIELPFPVHERIAEFRRESDFTSVPFAIWVVHLNLAKILRQIVCEEMPDTSVPIEDDLRNGETQIYRRDYARSSIFYPG